MGTPPRAIDCTQWSRAAQNGRPALARLAQGPRPNCSPEPVRPAGSALPSQSDQTPHPSRARDALRWGAHPPPTREARPAPPRHKSAEDNGASPDGNPTARNNAHSGAEPPQMGDPPLPATRRKDPGRDKPQASAAPTQPSAPPRLGPLDRAERHLSATATRPVWPAGPSSPVRLSNASQPFLACPPLQQRLPCPPSCSTSKQALDSKGPFWRAPDSHAQAQEDCGNSPESPLAFAHLSPLHNERPFW